MKKNYITIAVYRGDTVKKWSFPNSKIARQSFYGFAASDPSKIVVTRDHDQHLIYDSSDPSMGDQAWPSDKFNWAGFPM